MEGISLNTNLKNKVIIIRSINQLIPSHILFKDNFTQNLSSFRKEVNHLGGWGEQITTSQSQVESILKGGTVGSTAASGSEQEFADMTD
jgi:hypothetical protein